MADEIEEELAPFTYHLSKKNLDELFTNAKNNLFRIRVVNGQMSIEKSPSALTHSVPDRYIPHFQELHYLLPLPDLDLLISANDEIHTPSDLPLPICILSKRKEDPGVILIPDWFALKGYEPDKSQVLKGNRRSPWRGKRNILFFRGGDSGVFDNSSYSAWKTFPRPQLVALSIQYPRLIDAKFAISLHNSQFFEQAKKEGYIGNYVEMTNYIRNKYLMDIDGNCASAPRLGLLLHSNSVILKNMTNSFQWFYRVLIPYTHFIPVEEDLSDLIAQLQWAHQHPLECQHMSQRAQILAKEVLSQEAVYEYLYRLLVEYSRRQSPFYEN